MTTYTHKDLIKAPVGIAFQIETTNEQIYIKSGNCLGKHKGKDIQAEPLFDRYESGSRRMGFAETDQSILNSMRFYILELADLNTLKNNIESCILRRREIIKK